MVNNEKTRFLGIVLWITIGHRTKLYIAVTFPHDSRFLLKRHSSASCVKNEQWHKALLYVYNVVNKWKVEEELMKNNVEKMVLILLVSLTVVGFVLIFTSGMVGEAFGNIAMKQNGGLMDTIDYERVYATATTNVRTAGSILALVGGFGLLLSGYAYY